MFLNERHVPGAGQLFLSVGYPRRLSKAPYFRVPEYWMHSKSLAVCNVVLSLSLGSEPRWFQATLLVVYGVTACTVKSACVYSEPSLQ